MKSAGQRDYMQPLKWLNNSRPDCILQHIHTKQAMTKIISGKIHKRATLPFQFTTHEILLQ